MAFNLDILKYPNYPRLFHFRILTTFFQSDGTQDTVAFSDFTTAIADLKTDCNTIIDSAVSDAQKKIDIATAIDTRIAFKYSQLVREMGNLMASDLATSLDTDFLVKDQRCNGLGSYPANLDGGTTSTEAKQCTSCAGFGRIAVANTGITNWSVLAPNYSF